MKKNEQVRKAGFTVAKALVLASFCAVTGCGGGDQSKDEQTASSGKAGDKGAVPTGGTSVASIAAVQSTAAAAPAVSMEAPHIEGIEQVSAVRYDRTKFDYVFRVVIRGGATEYQSGAFNITSSATGTELIDGSVAVGRLRDGQILRLQDTFKIRHDRQYRFDKSKLDFRFSGVPYRAVDASGSVSINQVQLMKSGGRAGHGGLLPLHSDSPNAGESIVVRAKLLGNAVTGEFSIRDNTGGVLTSGVMTKAEGSDTIHATAMVVPAGPFTFSIVARSSSGAIATWDSGMITPKEFSILPQLSKATFKYSERLTGRILSTPSPIAMQYTVKMVLPEGFSSPKSTWEVSLAQGGKVDIPFEISTPPSGDYVSNRIIFQWTSMSNPSGESTSIIRILPL